MSDNYVEDDRQKQLTGIGVLAAIGSIFFPPLIPVAAGILVGKIGRKVVTEYNGPTPIDIIQNEMHEEAYSNSIEQGASIVNEYLNRVSQEKADTVFKIRINDKPKRDLFGRLTGEHEPLVRIYDE